MGTVHSSTVVTVSGGSISTNPKTNNGLLLDNRVKFVVRYMYDIDNNGFLDKNASNAWPFATPSLRAKVTGMRPLSRRTRRSWLTCGTRSPSWLILTRITKSQPKSSKKESSFHA